MGPVHWYYLRQSHMTSLPRRGGSQKGDTCTETYVVKGGREIKNDVK